MSDIIKQDETTIRQASFFDSTLDGLELFEKSMYSLF